MFGPTNYAEGLDNKAVVGMSKDAEGGGKVANKFFNVDEITKHCFLMQDDLEKVITGYQPVPQHPPASYPQGANSLPRCQVVIDDDDDDDDDNFDDEYDDDYDDDAPWQIILMEQTLFLDVRLPLNLK